MPSRSIPERAPVGDAFTGVVVEVNGVQALALTALADTRIVASGSFVVRYAVRYLGKPHLSIVPGLVALDYGDILTGDAAWDFLVNRSNLHPRADVLGYRNDGKDEMIVVKQLDLAEPIDVLVYADAATTTPIAHPAVLIAPESAEVADRVRRYLPRFDSIASWQAGLHE